MSKRVMLENIEEIRRLQGIDDDELRQEIRDLTVGDHVRLTFVNGTGDFSGETLLVRITSIRGYLFRGKLATKPLSTGLLDLHIGFPIVFNTAHIHSVPKEQPPHK